MFYVIRREDGFFFRMINNTKNGIFPTFTNGDNYVFVKRYRILEECESMCEKLSKYYEGTKFKILKLDLIDDDSIEQY